MPNTTGPWWLPASNPCESLPFELKNPPAGYSSTYIGFPSLASAKAYQKANCGTSDPTGGGRGKGGSVPLPGRHATFGAWKTWIDSKAPGQGDVWISWVESHAKITPPESGTVDLNASQFPQGVPFSQGGSSNYASNWFGAWILLGQVGPDLAKLLAAGIAGAAGKIPKILTGTARGIGQVPGAQQLGGLQAIGGFFSSLGDPHTWLRVAEVAVGVVLVAVALNAILKQTTGVDVAGSVAKSVPKVVPV